MWMAFLFDNIFLCDAWKPRGSIGENAVTWPCKIFLYGAGNLDHDAVNSRAKFAMTSRSGRLLRWCTHYNVVPLDFEASFRRHIKIETVSGRAVGVINVSLCP